ncbi:UDP-N-acetylmuramoyl-L-alanyl-D-glutamate--2,6-diaminopimelate ligase [Myceligenerans pegani]|uniref:UDP-N-acetylmuramyl-tripeptide synthetase n=1 Tax=Myceligenerans pegani TaxID=2776917 RepID=A0ABR9MZJ3_9MICO|nr:UDP-N-acetylmuramoyl-L-alanyl-D-glutamate--2,6-diaminopimelate ligase [Myceligenerans sp. TRM 65318]MBE1876446.1 UDP-N-acetylmuramoyl-L-alanyl-D-glutamate--2,6-diaminopimelate ligase [Myceligenerans sp. TRM 65318]MBE3018717.1 UDP-N-acetylmuramoyl-L-alanyl-D-glutamate--2,6-diaminopimelate ligase [Myceligenerans sp. TRM 65318]
MTSPQARIRPDHVTPRRASDLAAALGAPAPDTDAEVTGVVSDNRAAGPGDLFVALPGARVHGARFAADAVARGATAVLTDPAGAALLEAEATTSARPAVLVVADPRAAAGPAAAHVYGAPAERLVTFGLTGTNGKTTTTYQLDHVLRALGRRCGLVGTVETRSGDRVLPSVLTTPEAADLQAVLAAMVSDGVEALTMEVSSHAIAQHRVDGVVYDVAGFTNLTQDHLDFHGDLETYFATKAELFTPARSRRGVVVVDDEHGAEMARRAEVPVATLSTGTGVRPLDPGADWTVSGVAPDGTGSAFTLTHRDGRTLRTRTALPGGYNVANAALAAVMVLESGADVDAVDQALRAVDGLTATVPGRMEVLATSPRVVVDFAHNTEALELALSALRPTTKGRLSVVFGATGDRDPGKRPFMGAAAVRGADVVVVTDDDPHGEDRAAVRAAVLDGARAALAGLGRDVELTEIADRADAIARAITSAGADDTVLVAGRGHETIQEVAGVDHHLDDREEARAALAARQEHESEGRSMRPKHEGTGRPMRPKHERESGA